MLEHIGLNTNALIDKHTIYENTCKQACILIYIQYTPTHTQTNAHTYTHVSRHTCTLTLIHTCIHV